MDCFQQHTFYTTNKMAAIYIPKLNLNVNSISKYRLSLRSHALWS